MMDFVTNVLKIFGIVFEKSRTGAGAKPFSKLPTIRRKRLVVYLLCLRWRDFKG